MFHTALLCALQVIANGAFLTLRRYGYVAHALTVKNSRSWRAALPRRQAKWGTCATHFARHDWCPAESVLSGLSHKNVVTAFRLTHCSHWQRASMLRKLGEQLRRAIGCSG